MTEKCSSDQWGGRFNEEVDTFVARFTASIDFDQRLFRHDILGSMAHARMLRQTGILDECELNIILSGLESILKDAKEGRIHWSQKLEDIHMNIEVLLTERIGDAGKKLHTARSRNDQVATDIRLWLREEIDIITTELHRFQKALLDTAEREADTIMPGFTHLQIAQPVTFGHHLMAWYEMLTRDDDRLQDCRKRLNVCPLGAAALAGTTYPVNRTFTAHELGFDEPTRNSLDSVSDRDFAIEFCSVAALMMAHLSRMSEELVLWMSDQFGFICLPDRFCTGSSIMPQKKNPDVPELVRGKTGRVNGHLVSLLTLIKSQPLAYNKDNQEDKEPVFDTVDTVKDCLRALADMIPHIEVSKENMRNAARRGFSTATDLADYLVKKGVPFRSAHEVVGKAVSFGIEQGRDLSEMTLDELKYFSDTIDNDVFDILTLEGSVKARNHLGGTAPEQVREAIWLARQALTH